MTKIPTNTVKFVLTIDQDSGGIDIEAECNFSATTLRSVIDDGDWEDDDSGFSIEFEPADDLLDKITEKKNGSKVVLFNGKKLH